MYEVSPARGGNRVFSPEEMLAFIRGNVRINEDGCAIWCGAFTGARTPKIKWGLQRYTVRRLLCQLTGRPVRPHQIVYASCGSTLCVAEDHLRIGTPKQLGATLARLGLVNKGTVHGIAVARGRAHSAAMPMTERFAVRQMRLDGMTWDQIASKYGVHRTTPHAQFKAWEKRFGPAAFWVERRAA